MSAEYILSGGNYNVILCERGIRTFEPAPRNTLDLNSIPIIKKLSHLPIIVDPSHGIGVWDGVTAMSLAAIAAGADGLIIEVHNDPPKIKKLPPLPIIVAPSHGIGVWDGVTAMSLAAIAAGADGLIIEVHNDPAMALSDGYQSLKPSKFKLLLEKVEQLAPIMNRTLTRNIHSAQ